MGKEHFEEISIVLILFKRRIEIQTYADIACSPGQNTGVGSLSLLQGIFSTQRSNPEVSHIAGGFFTSSATREAQFASVMANSLQPYGLYPTRLLWPWDFPGKDTGVGCHTLLQGIFPTQG